MKTLMCVLFVLSFNLFALKGSVEDRNVGNGGEVTVIEASKSEKQLFQYDLVEYGFQKNPRVYLSAKNLLEALEQNKPLDGYREHTVCYQDYLVVTSKDCISFLDREDKNLFNTLLKKRPEIFGKKTTFDTELDKKHWEKLKIVLDSTLFAEKVNDAGDSPAESSEEKELKELDRERKIFNKKYLENVYTRNIRMVVILINKIYEMKVFNPKIGSKMEETLLSMKWFLGDKPAAKAGDRGYTHLKDGDVFTIANRSKRGVYIQKIGWTEDIGSGKDIILKLNDFNKASLISHEVLSELFDQETSVNARYFNAMMYSQNINDIKDAIEEIIDDDRSYSGVFFRSLRVSNNKKASDARFVVEEPIQDEYLVAKEKAIDELDRRVEEMNLKSVREDEERFMKTIELCSGAKDALRVSSYGQRYDLLEEAEEARKEQKVPIVIGLMKRAYDLLQRVAEKYSDNDS